MIEFPHNRAALLQIGVGRSLRAGGTDLQDRRHLGLASGPLVDLRDVPDLETIAVEAGPLQLGSRVRITNLANDPKVAQTWPALATG